jgi:DNA processing protein
VRKRITEGWFFMFSKRMIFRLLTTQGMTNQGMLHLFTNCVNQNTEHLSAFELANFAELTKSKKRFVENWMKCDLEVLEEQFYNNQFITILDNDYPDQLREIYNPPAVLFYEGNLSLLKRESLSVVGSRTLSESGKQAAVKLLTPLAKKYCFISGLARGMDTLAHKISIANLGSTVGVIGSGIDVVYPKENDKLMQYMKRSQLVISEYPKGTPPLRHHFPERNRIIAGLSFGVVVFEARLRSGSLITCERAMESGRDVFAVPGEIVSGASNGCHYLIQQGAKCVFQPEDILDEMPKNHD